MHVAALLVQGSVVILSQFVDPVTADDVCSTNFGFSLWLMNGWIARDTGQFFSCRSSSEINNFVI